MSRMNEPEIRVNEPGIRKNEPGIRKNEPEIRMNEPGIRMNEPGIRVNEPGIRLHFTAPRRNAAAPPAPPARAWIPYQRNSHVRRRHAIRRGGARAPAGRAMRRPDLRSSRPASLQGPPGNRGRRACPGEPPRQVRFLSSVCARRTEQSPRASARSRFGLGGARWAGACLYTGEAWRPLTSTRSMMGKPAPARCAWPLSSAGEPPCEPNCGRGARAEEHY